MQRQRKVLSPEKGNDSEQTPRWHEAEEGACTGTGGSAASRAVLVDILSQAELKERLVLEMVPADHAFTDHR